MEVEVLVPQPRRAPLEEVVSILTAPEEPDLPFSDRILDFCARFSQAIFKDREASRYPELAALGFWMRKAELVRLRAEFEKTGRPDTVAVPRGLVFHVPPANVDTIFVYSWLLAALAGNRNVIRMSSRRAPQSEILLRLWRELVEQAAPEMERNTVVVSYGHEEDATRALSLACDVRVIWGGDHTVTEIRKFPLRPHARELTFPDRSSLAVIQADRYAELGEPERAKLAERFFNDAYWFDQMACSSPRLVVWCGGPDVVRRASQEFWTALAECVERKGYASAAAIHMRKLVFACEAIIDQPVREYRRDREATVLELETLAGPPREACGGGLFFSARVSNLMELAPVLGRRDQTMTHFGFQGRELRDFARRLAGRAIDRMVPVGQALAFHRFWDGYDLLHEFCRLTYCEAPEGAGTAAESAL